MGRGMKLIRCLGHTCGTSRLLHGGGGEGRSSSRCGGGGIGCCSSTGGDDLVLGLGLRAGVEG